MATTYKRGGKKRRGGQYYIAYSDHNGERVVRGVRTTDKATAERIAAKCEADAALRREGVIDPTLDAIARESQRTIESHLLDFEAKLTSHWMTLAIGGRQVAKRVSPGLIPAEPKDAMNVGYDELTAAGDYTPPNRLRGTVRNLRVNGQSSK